MICLNIQDVLEKFSIISGLDTQKISQWVYLCRESLDRIVSRLKEDVDVEKNIERITTAAASLAFYKYTLYQASNGGLESFKAGDITIKNDKKESLNIAFKIYKDAQISILDLLEDENFIFERVESV